MDAHYPIHKNRIKTQMHSENPALFNSNVIDFWVQQVWHWINSIDKVFLIKYDTCSGSIQLKSTLLIVSYKCQWKVVAYLMWKTQTWVFRDKCTSNKKWRHFIKYSVDCGRTRMLVWKFFTIRTSNNDKSTN